MVIGWNMDQTVEGLIEGLGDFAPADSSVTIISPEKPDGIPEECGTCECRHLEGSVASRQVLLEVSSALSQVFFDKNSFFIKFNKCKLCIRLFAQIRLREKKYC